ncbi:MAG: DNA/RNA nuclease SfsA [Candidatus Freyarchaeota archaeon]|nr:DNA/RNA nuclease SfsA [Candidatus Jordarchaeia archaeon]MBS7270500.1 DNA/RNA nuclease SfsA [Candidatus Jordarchaeia archaeon]MBS7281263.1 DNA/RNA nuclease SfsA [Candidatus Jordarchaeia archaeon]
MRIIDSTVEAVFKERVNKFLTVVEVNKTNVPCFLPDPGRLEELLYPGVRVLLADRAKKYRKTRYDLIAVYHDDQLISLDSRIPNKLVFEALKNKSLDEFAEYTVIIPEYKFHDSRIDFMLDNGHKKCLLEVKSCTTVINGVALFPSAPTTRGRRHITELVRALKDGYRSCVLFVVQRTDAKILRPHDSVDQKFGNILREAYGQGVEVYAYFSKFTGKEITIQGKIPVDLSV